MRLTVRPSTSSLRRVLGNVAPRRAPPTRVQFIHLTGPAMLPQWGGGAGSQHRDYSREIIELCCPPRSEIGTLVTTERKALHIIGTDDFR